MTHRITVIRPEPQRVTVVRDSPKVSVVRPAAQRVTVVREAQPKVVTLRPEAQRVVVKGVGARGPTGPEGPETFFVSLTAPVTSRTRYGWMQTGLGPTGTGMTLWIEDGAV